MKRRIVLALGLFLLPSAVGCSAFVRSTRLSETLDNRFSAMYSTMEIPLTVGVVVPSEVRRHVLSGQARFQGNEEKQKKAPTYHYAVGRAIAAMMLPAAQIAFDFATPVRNLQEARKKKLDGILTVEILRNTLDVVFFYRKDPQGGGETPEKELVSIKGDVLLELEVTFYDLGHRPIWHQKITSHQFDTFPPEGAQDDHLFDPLVEESVQHAMEEMVAGLKRAPKLFDFSGTPRY
ncbi:MAG: hypothetical protein D6812_05640 [Deltaproteobacteria bacterium]|nr:MAG: hypothetical protein D6812_05640 [Deltaproteobacteria bacterium]